MTSYEIAHQLRRATWIHPPRAGRLSRRLQVIVPLSVDEMAGVLGIPTERVFALHARQPMFFFLKPHRWLGPN